jgi:hypothetical protein
MSPAALPDDRNWLRWFAFVGDNLGMTIDELPLKIPE